MNRDSLLNPPEQQLTDRLMVILEEAQRVTLDLSEEDSDYDLNYLSQRLAKCSSYQEKLSMFLFELSKISTNIIHAMGVLRQAISNRERSLKETTEYQEKKREEKTPWLREQVGELKDALESWTLLRRMVSEVKEAIGDRIQTLRRLDSDIRLHQRLIEGKAAAGAGTPDGNLKFDPLTEGDINLG